MRRREFIAGLGSAAAWPLAARAQQPIMPVVGFLSTGSADALAGNLAGLRKGLEDLGYVEGRNIMIEYRWAEGQHDRVPPLAADLVRHPLTVICANSPATVQALHRERTTIPIVFAMGEDPVKEGLVTSLNRPSGNITGLTTLTNQLFSKRLQLFQEIVPKTEGLALLINPDNPNAEPDIRAARAASAELGRELRVLPASSERDLEAVFTTMIQQRTGGLLVGVDNVFLAKRALLATLAVRHAVPTMFDRRDYPAVGGLMSYGTSYYDAWRLAGVYVGRILRGAKPADLPVQQATKIEFVLNLNTAKALGLTIPATLLATADEVIE
jgi:putative tryptophan/tyrosine transport system substrate-binding protein